MSTPLSTIKIPKTVYVGFQGRRSQDEVPLGFMTPWGDDQAGLKRRDTVDSWAKGHGREKTFNSVTLENTPMIGFKIGRSIRRSGGWGGSGASYVRIQDPRGFELEVTIENLVMTMIGNIVEDGELMQECVWGRNGNKNILLPTNSEPYRHSLDTTAKIKAKLSLKDIKPGDEIRMLTGEQGIYLGGMFPIESTSDTGGYSTEKESTMVSIGTSKRYVVKYLTDGKLTYEGKSSLQVSEIVTIAKAKLTPSEINLEIAQAIKNDANCCTNSTSNYRATCRGWIVSAKDVSIESGLITMTEAEIKSIVNPSGERHGYLSFKTFAAGNGEFISMDNYSNNFEQLRSRPNRQYLPDRLVGFQYYSSRQYLHATGFLGCPVEPIVSGAPVIINHNYYKDIQESDITNLYLMQFKIKTPSGEVFEIYL